MPLKTIQVGDMFEIRPAHDDGGFKFIRVEQITSKKIFVSTWRTPSERAKSSEPYFQQLALKSEFGFGKADAIDTLNRYWRRAKIEARAKRQST